MWNETNLPYFEFKSPHEIHAFFDLFGARGTTFNDVSFVAFGQIDQRRGFAKFVKRFEGLLCCKEAIEVPGNESTRFEQFFGIAREIGTTNEALIVGDNSADGNAAGAGLSLERKDGDGLSPILDDTDFDIVAGGGNGLGELGSETGILEIRIGMLQGAPTLEQGAVYGCAGNDFYSASPVLRGFSEGRGFDGQRVVHKVLNEFDSLSRLMFAGCEQTDKVGDCLCRCTAAHRERMRRKEAKSLRIKS